MSADSSPESGLSPRRSRQRSEDPSSQPMTEQARQSRYNRAAARAMETAPAELERQRIEARDNRRSVSERIRDERQSQQQYLAGRSEQARQIAELLTGSTPNGQDDQPDTSPRRAADQSDRPAKAIPPSADGRPALEIDEEDEGSDGREPGAPKTLKEFADEHELSATELHKLSVSIDRDIEPMTIEQMKARIKDMRNFETLRDDFEETRATQQNEILVARQQVEDVLQRLTEVVPPEHLARAFADMETAGAANLEKAKAQLNEWFPEWKEPARRVADRERLETVLATYGFTKFEVGAVRDPRLIKFAMDAIRKGDRYDRLKANINSENREKKPSSQPPSGKRQAPRQTATDKADAMAKAGDKVGAIAALLRG